MLDSVTQRRVVSRSSLVQLCILSILKTCLLQTRYEVCDLRVRVKQPRTTSSEPEDSRDLSFIPLKEPWKGAILRFEVQWRRGLAKDIALCLVIAHDVSRGCALNMGWLLISITRVGFVEEFLDCTNTPVPFWHDLECVVGFPVNYLYSCALPSICRL